MKYLFLVFLSIASVAQAQKSKDKDFDKMLKDLLSFSVPTVTCEQLNTAIAQKQTMVILDTREPEEYAVSHLPSARLAGYNFFTINALADVPKNTPIVVYCSVGYRSEKIGEKLKKAGYTNVFNLYGSIFEWANSGYLLVDMQDKHTLNVHTYNKKWSKWLKKGIKVY